MKRAHKALFAATAAVLIGRSAFSQVTNDTWTGPATGNWSLAGNWSNGEPNNFDPPDYNVFIDGGNVQNSNVTLNVNVTINNLFIDAGDQLTFANAKVLTLTDATLTNAGTVAIASSGSATDLVLNDITLSGGGTVVMSGNARIYGLDLTNRLTNVDNTIIGNGQIGEDFLLLTNQATIAASGSGSLVIDTAGSGNNNSGTLLASSGTLLIQDSTISNSGTISALTGATVSLSSTSSITGGTFTTAGTGLIAASGTGGNRSTLANFNNLGNITVVNGAQLVAAGTINNTGSINVNGTSTATSLVLSGAGGGSTITLSGGGSINLVGNARVQGNFGNETLVNGNNTIAGNGSLGLNALAMSNAGTVAATTNNTLVLDLAGTANVNTGTLLADGGTLNISGTTIDNSTGRLIAKNGGSLELSNATAITGGTLSTDATSVIETISTGGNRPTLTSVNNLGNLTVLDADQLVLAGTTNNVGSINLLSVVGDTTDLVISGDATLTGGGSVNMSQFSNNRIFGNVGTETLTNVNNMINGSGQIAMSFTNNGTLIASGAGGIFISPPNTGAATNSSTGVWSVAASSSLNLASGTLINNGTISSVVGGTINLMAAANLSGSGVIVNNGTFAVSGTGSITTVSGSGTTVINSTGSLSVTNIRGNALSVAGNLNVGTNGTATGTSVVTSLAFVANGVMDLHDNDLIIDYTGPDSTVVGTVRNMLKASSTNGTWAGPGLISTNAGASPNSAKTALGYIDTAGTTITSFSGQPVDDSAILIKYTYAGDSNLDGKVDVTDLGALASKWQQAGNWVNGDFNYDGTVNVTDLGILASNWQQGIGNPLAPNSFQQALADVGLGTNFIPEPTSIMMLGALAAWSIHRPRKRRA